VHKPVAASKLKRITQSLEVPPLPGLALRFAEWVARYTLTPLGMVARMMMGPSALFEPVRPRFGVRLAAAPPPRLTPARTRVLAIAADGEVRAKPALAAAAKCSTAVIDGLVTAGAVVAGGSPPAPAPPPHPPRAPAHFQGAPAPPRLSVHPP